MSLKNLLNQTGSALSGVVAVAAAVGVGALMVTQTGKFRSEIDRDMNQNTIIENTVVDIKTHLALEANCKIALDNNFSSLGDYTVGMDLTNGVSIESITDQNPGQRDRKIIILFKKLVKKEVGKEVAKRRPDQVHIQTFQKPDPSNPGNMIDTCTSYETTGVDSSMETICEAVGGVYDNTVGTCIPNYQGAGGAEFKSQVDQVACLVLGGNLVAGECSLVNIAGDIETSHFKLNKVDLAATDKIDSQNVNCPAGQIATGVDNAGNITCKAIMCPKPLGTYASTYNLRIIGSDYFCQCEKDRGPGYDCGQRFPSDIGDGLGCADEVVNDGCGTGATCTIRRKIPICPRAASCDEIVRNDCGEVCSTGPRSNTWRPSRADVCSTDTLRQTNDCGQSRTVSGTLDCTEDCTDSWSPSTSDINCGESFTQTRCSETRTRVGTKNCCTDTSWSPSLSDTCSTESVTQTSNCGNTRTRSGTKSCSSTLCTSPSGNAGDEMKAFGSLSSYNLTSCCLQFHARGDGTPYCSEPGESMVKCTGRFSDTGGWEFSRCGDNQRGCRVDNSSWTPRVTSVCAGESFTQTSNCNTTRTRTGTRNCSYTWKEKGSLGCSTDMKVPMHREYFGKSCSSRGNTITVRKRKASCGRDRGVELMEHIALECK